MLSRIFDENEGDHVLVLDYPTTTISSLAIDRDLTYLDTDGMPEQENETISEIGLVVGFSVISAVFGLVTILIINVNSTCQEFYEWNAIRLIMPALSLFLCIQNATLAFDAARVVASQWAIAVYMMSSTVAPGIFLFTFVITFLAYRTRAMPFCFVYRGPGRQAVGEPWRDDDEEVMQPLVRPAVLVVSIRIFALGLLILNLIVSFDVVWNEEDLAGQTGWLTVIQDSTNSSIDHIILALVPMALVCFCCLYFSLLLWRYGCEFSLVIYGAGIINPWLCPFCGTLTMMAGQCFGPDLFLITSNSGILIFMLSVVRVLFEVRFDMKQARDLGNFLNILGNDTVANTQSGLEKYTQDDTISSGQQHWAASENKEGASISPRAEASTTFVEPHQSSRSRKNDVAKPPSLPESGDHNGFDGVTLRPDKVRRGQRPKGKFAAH
jgi:hypothetical protein